MAQASYMKYSDSSDDELEPVSNGIGGYSPPRYIPDKNSAESSDEGFSNAHDETASYTSQATSTFSAQSLSSGYSSQPDLPLYTSQMNVYNQMSQPSTMSFKRKSIDTEDNDEQLDIEPAVKKKKYDYESYAKKAEPVYNIDTKAQQMMSRMGYKEGKGLGRHEQGRVAPIELSKQQGRRGLGRTLKALEPESLTWDSTQEVVNVEEVPKWLHCHLPELSPDELVDWSKEGPTIMAMESFSDFCDPELLDSILTNKTVFDDLDEKELLKAVKRSNPFETIASGIFQNRAAMKMANMDKVFSWMFTNPVDKYNNPLVGENDLLYFADVCAGPGGFSEYVLYRKQWQAKGIGFTLRASNDFKLDKFLAGTPETFEPYYGVKGDGDIYEPENIESLTQFVMAKTDNLGVHFMMADGGFSVAGQENIQELLSKRLYLCQCLVALSIVRTGGHFVCKLFDLFSPFSVGIIYLMYRAFDSICIHKPNSSRPANSERYIICKSKRSDCDAIRGYMFELNERLQTMGNNSKIDITDCVPMAELNGDPNFFNYIIESNNTLGERQLLNLVKVINFCKDINLTEPKQADMRLRCLKYWEVEDVVRKHDTISPETMAAQILRETNLDFAAATGEEIKCEEKLKSLFPSILDWTCIPISDHSKCNFYIGCKKRVYVLRKNGKGWTTMDNKIKLELSPGTIVYGEITEDVHGTYRAQMRVKIFHIIDAISLGKKIIANRSYATRIKLCKLYARALHKSCETQSVSTPMLQPISLRTNNYYELKHFFKIFQGLDIRPDKSRGNEILFHVADDMTTNDHTSENYYFPIKGIMFYKITKQPWLVMYSRTNKKVYYFNTANRESLFTPPMDINSGPIDCYKNRRLWNWDIGVGIMRESPKENVLHMESMRTFIEEAKSKMTD